MASNSNGLIVKVDGHLLSSVGAPLQFTVPYGQEVSAFVEIERVPGGAYNFTDVELVLTGVTDTELEGATYPEIRFGSCASKTVKLNIQYDEPCVDIRITDPSERFTINEDSAINGHYSQTIEIHNPEGLDRTRSWRTRYESGSNELKIQIQYRRVGTEEDFRAITGSSDQINKTVRAAPYTSSYFTYTWHMDDVAEGIYEIRAVSQCKIPDGAADKSAYIRESNRIIAHIDHFDPEVFGSPLPVDNVNVPFYPGGEPFQVDFNEPITCDSKFRDPNHDSKPKATAVFWNQAQQRQSIDLQAQCNPTATSLLLAFQRQHLKLVAGRQVNVTVENIVDLADNQMKVNPAWSFTVANLGFVPQPTNSVITESPPTFAPPASSLHTVQLTWTKQHTIDILNRQPTFQSDISLNYRRFIDPAAVDADVYAELLAQRRTYSIVINATATNVTTLPTSTPTPSINLVMSSNNQLRDIGIYGNLIVSENITHWNVLVYDWLPPYEENISQRASGTWEWFLTYTGNSDEPHQLLVSMVTFTQSPASAPLLVNAVQIPNQAGLVQIDFLAPEWNGLNSVAYDDSNIVYQLWMAVDASSKQPRNSQLHLLQPQCWQINPPVAMVSKDDQDIHGQRNIVIDFISLENCQNTVGTLEPGSTVYLRFALEAVQHVGVSRRSSIISVTMLAPPKPFSFLHVTQTQTDSLELFLLGPPEYQYLLPRHGGDDGVQPPPHPAELDDLENLFDWNPFLIGYINWGEFIGINEVQQKMFVVTAAEEPILVAQARSVAPGMSIYGVTLQLSDLEMQKLRKQKDIILSVQVRNRVVSGDIVQKIVPFAYGLPINHIESRLLEVHVKGSIPDLFCQFHLNTLALINSLSHPEQLIAVHIRVHDPHRDNEVLASTIVTGSMIMEKHVANVDQDESTESAWLEVDTSPIYEQLAMYEGSWIGYVSIQYEWVSSVNPILKKRGQVRTFLSELKHDFVIRFAHYDVEKFHIYDDPKLMASTNSDHGDSLGKSPATVISAPPSSSSKSVAGHILIVVLLIVLLLSVVIIAVVYYRRLHLKTITQNENGKFQPHALHTNAFSPSQISSSPHIVMPFDVDQVQSLPSNLSTTNDSTVIDVDVHADNTQSPS